MEKLHSQVCVLSKDETDIRKEFLHWLCARCAVCELGGYGEKEKKRL